MHKVVPAAAIAAALVLSLSACGGAPGRTPTVAGPSDVHPTSPGGDATPTPTVTHTTTPALPYTSADILATITVTAKAANGSILLVTSTIYVPERYSTPAGAAIAAVLSAAGDHSSLVDPTWLHDNDAETGTIAVTATHQSGPGWPATSPIWIDTGDISAVPGATTAVGLPTTALGTSTDAAFGWALTGAGTGYYAAAYDFPNPSVLDDWWKSPAYFGARGGQHYTMTACTIRPTRLLTAHDDIWGPNAGAFSDTRDASCEIGFGGE